MNEETKKCPYCNEEIQPDAVTCEHCGGVLEEKDDLAKDVISQKDIIHIALLAALFLAVNTFSFLIKRGMPAPSFTAAGKLGYLIGGVIGTGFISLCVGFAFYLVDRRSPRPRRIKTCLIIAAFFSSIVLLMRVFPQ